MGGRFDNDGCRGVIGRRVFLAAIAVAGVSAGGAMGSRRPITVELAGGDVDGDYHTFAEFMADLTADHSVVRVGPVATSGSRTNVDLLARGEAEAALVMADSVYPALAYALALGRISEDYLHLVVPADSPIRRVADLRGKRVNLGADGSGAAFTGNRLLRAAGLDPHSDLVVRHRRLRVALAAMRRGDLDALLWAGAVPTPALATTSGMRLIDLAELVEPMRKQFEHPYDRVEIPAGAYPGGAAVSTIGVANLLLATRRMDYRAAGAITGLLLHRAADLVPEGTVGIQFSDGHSMIGTDIVPLHPAAAAVYRRWHG